MVRKFLLSLAGAAVIAGGAAQANPAADASNIFRTPSVGQDLITEAAMACRSRCWLSAGRRVCKRSCVRVRPDDRPIVERPIYRPLK
jgi:hypothetical protein